MNVFLLVVDAMTNAYENIDAKYSPTPFMDSLKKKGTYCTNVFSQGPYTEAALTPFYTGYDNLTLGGNFFRGDECEKTSFESFSENGYDVLGYTQPMIYPNPMGRGLNCERYGLSYSIDAVFDYRIYYYVDLYKSGNITDKDYKKLEKLLDSNFDFSFRLLDDLENKSPAVDFILKYANVEKYDLKKNYSLIHSEHDKYVSNKKAYIDSILILGKTHKLFSFEKLEMDCKTENSSDLEYIKKKYKRLLRKIAKFNKKSKENKKHNFLHTAFNCTVDLFSGKVRSIKNDLRKYYYYKKLCGVKAQIRETFKLKSNYKPEPTFLRYYEHFKNWNNDRDKAKPFMCYMHVSDLHTPEIFFSIDSKKEVVKKELDVLSAYLDTLPKNFCGNVMYLLSMRYVDMCVEKMYKDMDNSGMLKDTALIITADHGSSFRFWPLRENIVNNCYVENYKIPLLFVGSGIESKVNENFYTTKDIVKTMQSIAKVPFTSTGKDILKGEKSEYSITEYLGGGCPDIIRRKVLFVLNDKDYAVVASNYVFDQEINIEKVFDKKTDFFMQNNIKEKVDKSVIDKYAKVLFNRLQEIKKQI